MTESVPDFMPWVDTTGPEWKLKPGAPAHVVAAFEESQKEDRQYWAQRLSTTTAKKMFEDIKEV